MRVLHGPTEISGQMGILCEGLLNKGYKASGYNWFNNYIKYNSTVLNSDAYELAKLVNVIDKQFDIVHFHNGNTLLPNFADLPMLNTKGVKMIMHHWGNDVRTIKKVKELNPYPLPNSYLTDDQIHKNLCYISKFVPTAIVQDYETYHYVKDYYKEVHILPLACNVDKLNQVLPNALNEVPNIVPAPTNIDFKGSLYVESSIDRLEGKAKFTYQRIQGVPHSTALQLYRNADIVIDQLLCGTYGMLSVEAMAMGKVVVAFIREDVQNHLPGHLPIVNANPDTLYGVLLDLLQDQERLTQIGQASRKYVLDYHNASTVVSHLCNIYRQLSQ